MGFRGLRFLLLVCCIPLILPPGWCCYLLLKIEPKPHSFAPISRSTMPVEVGGLVLLPYT